MRGRKRTPTALKIMAGNPGKRPLPANEPKPVIGPIPAPDWLDDMARVEWADICERLERVGVLSEMDKACLAAYCQSYSTWVAAERILQAEGLTFQSEHGPKSHPATRIAATAKGQMLRYLQELGMTPASRSKVQAHKPPEPDEFDVYLSKAKAQ